MEQRTARIAIVDDEESVRRALLRLFRTTEFDAHSFASAEEFLDCLHEDIPDCLILDLHMPGTTGIELLRLLARRDDMPPVIIITARDDQPTHDECLALGTRHYLRKPVESDVLLEAVRESVSPADRDFRSVTRGP